MSAVVLVVVGLPVWTCIYRWIEGKKVYNVKRSPSHLKVHAYGKFIFFCKLVINIDLRIHELSDQHLIPPHGIEPKW